MNFSASFFMKKRQLEALVSQGYRLDIWRCNLKLFYIFPPLFNCGMRILSFSSKTIISASAYTVAD